MKEDLYRAVEVQEHLIPSSAVSQTFSVKVFQPVSRSDGSERFPVVYATDADEVFGALACLSRSLHDSGETPRFILVGIGYEGACIALRSRDLFTHEIRKHLDAEIRAETPLAGTAADLSIITRTTDANDFLRFIREELMPFVNSHYPTVAGDDSFVGYSAGATFGLFALFSQPETFRRYILGSPCTSYNSTNFAIDLAQRFIESGRTAAADVFLSVGELEEFKRGTERFDFVSGLYRLVKFLNQASLPGLHLTFKVFPSETHATAWPPSFVHGLKTVFGPVDAVPYWPEFLKR